MASDMNEQIKQEFEQRYKPYVEYKQGENIWWHKDCVLKLLEVFIEEKLEQAKREAVEGLTKKFVGQMPHPVFAPKDVTERAVVILNMFTRAKEAYLKSISSKKI